MKNVKLKISIVTPSYNQGRFIEETIKSVLNQNYKNFEYIIIDGGSTDNTIEIIKKYEDKITYWVSEKDRGQTHAINKGFERCTGDIFAYINSDDVYCDNIFEKIEDYFENNQTCNILVGNGLFTNENGKSYLRKHPQSSKFLERNGWMNIFQPSTFIRKKAIEECGLLNENFKMCMDLEWFCRIVQIYPYNIINLDVSKFRWHSESKSSSKSGSFLNKVWKEETLIIMTTIIYPKYKKLILKLPTIAFNLYNLVGLLVRVFLRIKNNEIWKLNDKVYEK